MSQENYTMETNVIGESIVISFKRIPRSKSNNFTIPASNFVPIGTEKESCG